MLPIRMGPLNALTILFPIIFKPYFLLWDYLLVSGLRRLITYYAFQMLYHIVVRINLLSIVPMTEKIISRIWKLLVASFMYDRLVFVTSVSIKILDKEFFLIMFPILINYLFDMMKIWKGSKLLLTQNLMRVLMISQSIIYHRIVNILFDWMVNVSQLTKMNWQH